MKERERQVKDLALICRPLMIALCTAYCFIVIMFGIVLISSPPTRDYTDPEGKDFYQFARLHFGCKEEASEKANLINQRKFFKNISFFYI